MERVLERVERGETSARLVAPTRSGRSAGLVRHFNALLAVLEGARTTGKVYPRELSLAQERYEELLRTLSAIRRLSDVLCTAGTPEEVCSRAAAVLADELEYDHCSLLLYDREKDELREVGVSDRKAGAARTFPAGSGSLGLAFRRRRPTLVYPPSRGRSGFAALAPLEADGERLGLIKLARPLRGVPNKHVQHALVLLSGITARMLKTVELKRRLNALNDGLGREMERVAALSARRSQELQRLGTMLDEFLEANDEPVLIFGTWGRLFRLNRAAAALWGRPASELLGCRFSALLPRKVRREVTAAAVAALRAGTRFERRISVRRGSGRPVALEVCVRRISVPGGDSLCLVSARPAASLHVVRAPERLTAAAPGQTGAAPKKLLIIDDEVQLLESLKELLADLHHQVTVAATGQEGVSKAAKEEFDLVLTDLGLPGMSGWEVAERIKARSPSTPVGIMTGGETGEPPGGLKARGIDFVLRKPFELQQILDCLEATATPSP